jgi:hypothetical protein
MAREEPDMTAVQRDAQTIQAIASRVPALIDDRDPIALHLAAWVAEIDRDIDPSVVVQLPQRPVTSTSPSGPRRSRVVGVAGATVVALLVSSGAAAAVTGDPLAAVRAPLSAIKTINPFAGDSPSQGTAQPQKPLPTAAETNQLLADAQRAIAQGDLERAAELLDQARASGVGQQLRADRLADRLEAAKDPKGKGPQDATGKGPKDTVDKDTVDKDPQDKNPKGDKAVDKDPQDKDPQGGQGGQSAERDAAGGGTGGGQSETQPGSQSGSETGTKSGTKAGGKAGTKAGRGAGDPSGQQSKGSKADA